MRKNRILLMQVSLALLIGIQFIPVQHQPLKPSTSQKGIEHQLFIPAGQLSLLKNACYDCHSDEIRRPWYAAVAPVSWIIEHHISEGRKNLNFSRWADYSSGIQAKKLDEILEQFRQGAMPPWNYTLLHPSARLTQNQTQSMIKYLESLEN